MPTDPTRPEFATSYPNAKVNRLLCTAGSVSDFDPRDFLDLAMAALEQCDLVSRADYEKTRTLLDSHLPEGAEELGPRLDAFRRQPVPPVAADGPLVAHRPTFEERLQRLGGIEETPDGDLVLHRPVQN